MGKGLKTLGNLIFQLNILEREIEKNKKLGKLPIGSFILFPDMSLSDNLYPWKLEFISCLSHRSSCNLTAIIQNH